jgi:CHAT domain-containing protein
MSCLISKRKTRLNTAGRLGQARVLAFATHSLLGGDLTDLTQPALVLTPPATPSPDDDGLLSLEEILHLKLAQTRLVVLSGCNTAAADGIGEGLSGLTRAFFFAGAPAVLVSHWSVEDRATQAFMAAVFHRAARTPPLSWAEVVRQGTLALLHQATGDTAYFAHPFAWAPFVLVGDGGLEAPADSARVPPRRALAAAPP